MNILQWFFSILGFPFQHIAFAGAMGFASSLIQTGSPAVGLMPEIKQSTSTHEHAREISDVYQEWESTLSADERAWCERAIKNVIIRVRNIGEINARELIVMLLLHLKSRSDHQKKFPPVTA